MRGCRNSSFRELPVSATPLPRSYCLRGLRAYSSPNFHIILSPPSCPMVGLSPADRGYRGFPGTLLVGNSVNRGQGATSSPLTASIFADINQSRRRWVEAKNFVLYLVAWGRREPVAQPATSEKSIPLRNCGRKEEPLYGGRHAEKEPRRIQNVNWSDNNNEQQ